MLMAPRNLNHKHHVLVGPRGKRAGLRLGNTIALQMLAIELCATGRGGGIVALLLPNTPKEWNYVFSLTAKGYSYKEVQPRRTIRSEIREAAVSDNLIVQLAILFEKDKGWSKKAISAVNREFSIWVTQNLRELPRNKVKIVIEKSHPELLNRTSIDWWKKQLNQRLRK
jgi:hypothetical protein